MTLRIGKILSLLACVYLVGGHWAVLQSVAWVGMLADYGRAYGLQKGVAMTFDGAHPCAMCRGIQKKKNDETQQSAPGFQLSKMEKAVLPVADLSAAAPVCESSHDWAAYTAPWFIRSEAPPVPVPKSPFV